MAACGHADDSNASGVAGHARAQLLWSWKMSRVYPRVASCVGNPGLCCDVPSGHGERSASRSSPYYRSTPDRVTNPGRDALSCPWLRRAALEPDSYFILQFSIISWRYSPGSAFDHLGLLADEFDRVSLHPSREERSSSVPKTASFPAEMISNSGELPSARGR